METKIIDTYRLLVYDLIGDDVNDKIFTDIYVDIPDMASDDEILDILFKQKILNDDGDKDNKDLYDVIADSDIIFIDYDGVPCCELRIQTEDQ